MVKLPLLLQVRRTGGSSGEPDERRSARAAGQTVAEMALVVPLLVLLVAGALDLGRVFYSYAGVANATRVGSAYALTLGGAGSQGFSDQELAKSVRDRIRAEAAAYVPGGAGLEDGNIIFDPGPYGPPGWPSGSEVTITVWYDFPLLIPLSIMNWATDDDGNGVHDEDENDLRLSYTSTVRLR